MSQDLVRYQQRIGVFVIAYNAEKHIARTLRRIPAHVWEAVSVVYVIDDCSTDQTVESVSEVTLEHTQWQDKLRIMRNTHNHRYGGNQKLGYLYALEQGLDVVVMLHADGQYAPEVMESLLLPILRGEQEVVLGSRMMTPGHALAGGMPGYKYYGNRILTTIQNALCATALSEFHSGYRAYATSFLRDVPFTDNTDDWHFDTQILIQAHAVNARICEVPIPTYYGDEICYVNGIPYAAHCVLTTLAYYLHRRGLYYVHHFDLNPARKTYTSKFADPTSSHSLIWEKLCQEGLVGKKVLEIDSGDDALTRRLLEAGAKVDTVELDARHPTAVVDGSKRVPIGELDSTTDINLDDDYDILIAADVLEHLRHPDVALSRFKQHLRRDGLLIVSLPNIANIYVRVNLLFGRFPSHRKGILDRTHLRFFTLDSARKLLRSTGWVEEKADVTPIPIGILWPFTLRRGCRWLLSFAHRITRCLKGLLAYQVLFYCRNPNRPQALRQVSDQPRQLEALHTGTE